MPASKIIMIQPAAFDINAETVKDNVFQVTGDAEDVQLHALKEFKGMVHTLEEAGVEVQVFTDEVANQTPDSIFPNNWFSTHMDGSVVLYPMMAENRRRERRSDIIEFLLSNHQASSLIDFSTLEGDDMFLEGTGSLVLDHENRVAYMAHSERSNQVALENFCETLDFKPFSFKASYKGKSIYHTNVLMSVGSDWVIMCMDVVAEDDKERVWKKLEESGKSIIPISEQQMTQFLGNCLELESKDGERLLALSASAYDSLNETQREQLSAKCKLLPIPIPTIETYGGGSVRCMIAENYLTKK